MNGTFLPQGQLERLYEHFQPTDIVRYHQTVYCLKTQLPKAGQYVAAKHDDFARQISAWNVLVCRGKDDKTVWLETPLYGETAVPLPQFLHQYAVLEVMGVPEST